MPTASTGLAVTGSSAGLVSLLQWALTLMQLPTMSAEAAGGAILLIALIGHGTIKLINGLASWWMAKQAGRREVWTNEQRAAELMKRDAGASPPA